MLIEELIEKAFSDGYEYAQKEFATYVQVRSGLARSGAFSKPVGKKEWGKMLRKNTRGKVVGSTNPNANPITGSKQFVKPGDTVHKLDIFGVDRPRALGKM